MIGWTATATAATCPTATSSRCGVSLVNGTDRESNPSSEDVAERRMGTEAGSFGSLIYIFAPAGFMKEPSYTKSFRWQASFDLPYCSQLALNLDNRLPSGSKSSRHSLINEPNNCRWETFIPRPCSKTSRGDDCCSIPQTKTCSTGPPSSPRRDSSMSTTSHLGILGSVSLRGIW